MSLSTQHIIRHLFRVESLEEVSRQQLEELVETYPSFGVGRYLLSRKLQDEKADHFGEETQKTNLYFTNPFWLQWLLQEDLSRQANGFEHIPHISHVTDTFAVDAPPADTPLFDEPGLPAEEVFAPVTDTTEPTIDSGIVPPSEPDEVGESFLAASLPPSAADELLKSIAELKDRRQTDAVVDTTEPLPPSAADELLKSISELRDQRQAAQTPVVSEEEVVPEEEAPSVSIAGLALEQVEESEQPIPEHPTPEQPLEEHAFIEEPAPVEQPPAVETASEEPPLVESFVPAEQPPIEETAPAEQPPIEAFTPAGQTSMEQSPVEPPPPSIPEPSLPPTPEPAPAPIFEPYHTVDYFASQGIRLVLDENPSDRLGRQMKSFTDWLKVMRKLPQKNREIIPDIAAELQVQAIAAHSIERKEVITEAMAEVLAKQGMREKATEMYRKLSLLEPEKSAYFAEKIEQLKII